MISIVTTYYNRKPQFVRTLDVINRYAENFHDGLEVIVVDDASDASQSLRDLPEKYPFTIKLLEIEKSSKQHFNPCVPFNIGFREVKGDTVILQSPECYYTDNIFKHITDNFTPGTYASYACYSPSKPNSDRFASISPIGNTFEQDHVDLLKEMRQVSADENPPHGNRVDSWYNHSVHRPCHFHFTAVISKDDLDDLNGFDERYAQGVGYDDNELVARAKRKGMDCPIYDDLPVIHQFHPLVYDHVSAPANNQLFHNMTLNEASWSVNAGTVYGA